MFILNRPARMLGAGIGFAKEYNADRKSQKASNEDENDSDDNGVEWAQAIDEAQIDNHLPAASTNGDLQEEDLVASFIQRHPPPPYIQQQPEGKLPLPVILPQRRPHSRTRGWVRGYAPVLQDAGIDQAAWFDFLDQFEKSIDKNNVFWALNAAVWISDHAYLATTGNIWIKPIVLAIHLSVETGRRGYIHNKHNKLLDEMNDQYFKPRGAYALIVKYKPNEPNELGGWVDIGQNITQSVVKRDDPNRSGWDNILKGSASTSEGDDQIPEFAPLVFPFFNEKDEEQSENAFKHFQAFRKEYQDRAAAAQFAARNPESRLGNVAPQTEYASRYSNPNHPARQGLLGLVTGGKVNPQRGIIRGRFSHKGEALAETADDISARNTAHNENVANDGVNRNQVAWQAVKKPRRMGSLLRQDALYLMVVNMPSEEEMAQVRQLGL